MLCLAILHSIDHLHHRYHLPLPLVLETKTQLHRLLHIDLAECVLPPISETWTNVVVAFKIWATHAREFLEWVLDCTTDLRSSYLLRLCVSAISHT